MKCIHCHNKIDQFNQKYEIHGYDGDFIHTNCKKAYDEQIERICNMTDREFINWMLEV